MATTADPPAIEISGRPPWRVVLPVAALTGLVPVVALLAVVGPPTDLASCRMFAVPLAVAMAVTLTRARIELAVLLVAVATVLLVGDNGPSDASAGWASAVAGAMYAGVAWVATFLGRLLPLGRSAIWLAACVLVALLTNGLDVPMLLLLTGWWVVGCAFRHRQQMTDRLRSRADELAAEQDRFVAEAVRLERARIARELHDVVAHCLTVIVIQARAGQQLARGDRAATGGALDAIADSVEQATADLAALLAVTDPEKNQDLTTEAVDLLVRRAVASGADVRIDLRGDLGTLDGEWSAITYRALRESLTNAMRHSPGSLVTIALDCRPGLVLTVRNGPGSTQVGLSDLGTGSGLGGVRDRVAELGGTAVWGPTPDGGWQVSVRENRSTDATRGELAAR